MRIRLQIPALTGASEANVNQAKNCIFLPGFSARFKRQRSAVLQISAWKSEHQPSG
jgi:hypothetical protein